MAKKRDFDNPVFVKITPKNGSPVSVPVAEYRVLDKWLVLTRVDDSRVTKYISLDTLASYEFDEPLSYKVKHQDVELEDSGLPTTNSPERNALVAAIKGEGPAPVRRVKNPRAVPVVPQIPELSESEMIVANMRGTGVARMG